MKWEKGECDTYYAESNRTTWECVELSTGKWELARDDDYIGTFPSFKVAKQVVKYIEQKEQGK